MSSPAARDGCRARIFHVNDVYVLDNLPALRACVREESSGIPRRNVMVDLAGDFLGPSLLSSLDHGASMIDVLNRVPVNVVCFGNHEADVPYAAMRRRCDEFKGTWLNSNMPSFEHPNVVAHAEWKLDGNPNRSVALIGLNVGGGVDASLYREGAIGGHAAKIVPVMDAVDAAVAAARAAFPDADCVVPLTHQSVAEDVALAKREDLGFPCVLGGHDHAVFDETHGARGCRVVKAGEDAKRVVIVDLFWPAEAPRGSAPEVTVQFKPLAAESEASGGGGGGGGGAPYVPDPKLAAIVERWSAPAIELQTATLADLSKHPSHPLSSRDVRSGPNSMATVLATALKVATRAEVALLNSGGVRAKKIYEDGKITYADLSAECPFPAPFVVMKISGKALSDALVASRTRWHVEGGPEEDGDSFQVDDGIAFDATTDEIQTVMYGKPLELERLYELVVDSYMIGVNPVLKAWREANPALIPPDDAGRPALPILVQYFCDKAWTALVDEDQDGKIETAELDAFFDAADADGSGKLDEEEVLAALREKLGHMASSVVARQMLAAADRDQDGKVSKTELVHLMKLRAGREE